MLRSEKERSSKPIKSVPFVKSDITSASAKLVVASDKLHTKISAPPFPVKVSLTPAPVPP